MNGNFTISWQDGTKYQGKVQDNALEGEGKMTFSDGTTVEGLWSNDGLVSGKAATLKKPNGDMASNYCADGGRLEGEGEVVVSGCAYSGTWSNGKLNGQGRVQLPSGATYTGTFK